MAPRSRHSTPVRPLAALLAALGAAACTDGATAPAPPTALEIVAETSAALSVGATLAPAPAVRVVDAAGQGVRGVPVVFRVAAGGGIVAGDTVVSDASGRAAAALWVLGTRPGENRLVAEAAGLAPVQLRVVAVAGAAARLATRAGDGLVAPAGTATPAPPSVLVSDRYGNAAAGATVTFAVTAGGGAVDGGTAVTDAQGIATAGAWTLGDAGENRLRASVAGAAPVDFTATATSLAGTGSFDIEVRYLSAVSTAQRQAVERAVERWRRVILGDLPNVALKGSNACGRADLTVDETVDDLLLWVDFDDIDGVNGILGQAGPCFIRTGSSLPVAGILTLDGADLDNMAANGTLDDVILHEIGHVLGIGTLWSNHALLTGAGGVDPYFTGSQARAAFTGFGGSGYTGTPVPVENTGGAGTRDGHWRESVLRNELMTGYISAAQNPLSALTVGSLADMGYQVGGGAADAYTLNLTSGSGFMAPEAEGVQLRETPLPFAPVPVPAVG